MIDALDVVGNPAALHRAGQRAKARLEEAREELARAVGCEATEVVFTSGGSEADTLGVLGAWTHSRQPRALVSAIEHPAVLGAVEHGAARIPVSADGVVDLSAMQASMDGDVGVVSVMAVNNETGRKQDVDQFATQAFAWDAHFHTDAVQSFHDLPWSFEVGSMAISAHKIGGPVGIGALILKKRSKLAPVGLGGGQERKIRSGTQMVALAAGFAAAATEARESAEQEASRLRSWNDTITAAVDDIGATVNSRGGAPHIVNATFHGTRADDVLFLLDSAGVHASVGSACRAGVHQPSEVLLAMGRSVEDASATLRFSMGWNTTEADVDRLLDVLPGAVERARSAY